MANSVVLSAILLDWFDQNRRDLPWRKDRTAYGTWISETMLQQTRVNTVIPYFERFLEMFPDIPSLSAAPLEDVYKAWEGLGYYSRAANLQKGARCCTEQFGGALPQNYNDLMTIQGIGPYTAGAIASLAFGLPEPAVDGNVIRVFSRLYALPLTQQDEKSKREVTDLVRRVLPEDRSGDFNESIMDLGATVCIPGCPACGICPVSNFCQAFLLGKQSELPLKKAKKPSPVFTYTIVILKKGNTLFIRQRPDTGLLANLFEFSSYPGLLHPGELQTLLFRDFNLSPQEIGSITSLGEATHVFSHIKWEMEGYLVEINEINDDIYSPLQFSEKEETGNFYTIHYARKMAFPSALKAYTAVVFR